MNPTNDLRDIKDIVPVPYPAWVWWLVAGLIVAGVILVWLWRRRKSVTVTAPPVRVLTPAEIAHAALQKLRTEQPAVEEFYTRLSDIVRQYIEGQFGLHAPERTTEEFLAEAMLPAESMALLSAFLQEADLVKFARLQPGKADVDRAFGAAESFVSRTGEPATVAAGMPLPHDLQPAQDQQS